MGTRAYSTAYHSDFVFDARSFLPRFFACFDHIISMITHSTNTYMHCISTYVCVICDVSPVVSVRPHASRRASVHFTAFGVGERALPEGLGCATAVLPHWPAE